MNNYESLRDYVYKYISNKIQVGELTANQKISEADICRDLSISRTPAREALIKLASDNLIEYAPRRGFFVKELSIKEKLDIYSVIGCLDGFAAASAVDKMTEDDLEKMAELVDEIEISIENKDYSLYIKLQFSFHRIYIEKVDNKTLVDSINALENSFLPITYANKNHELLFPILRDVNEEHRHIIELFRKKDKEELEHFLRNIHWATKYLDMV